MKNEELIESIPEYINGLSNPEITQKIEDASKQDEDFYNEIVFLRNLKETIKKESISSPTEWGLKRLKKSISEQSSQQQKVKPVFWRNMTIAASVAFAAQTGFFIQTKNTIDQNFIPLSETQIEDTIRIKFREQTTEKQKIELLINLQANIVSGPSALGIYTIHVENSERAINILKNKQIVEYAEKTQ